MSKNIRTQMNKVVGKSLNAYYQRVKPAIDDIKFKEQYQGRIIDCIVGEVDDNYIETPETDNPIVKLEHSKEGVVKMPSIKGKTVLVDAEGNETDVPGDGCRLISVGEDEDNKIIISSKNKNLNDNPNNIIKDNGDGFFNTSQGTFGMVRKNRTYTVSCDINTTSTSSNLRVVGISLIDGTPLETYETLGSISNGKYKMTFTPTMDAYIGFNGSNYSNTTLSNIQLEDGSEATSYVPHKSNKTEILLNEPLRSLLNGTCDEIVGNKIIRKVGVRHRETANDLAISDIAISGVHIIN